MAEQFVNFYAGSPLNRLAWLRTSHHFLNSVSASPRTRWMLFNSGNPLGIKSASGEPKIVYLTTADVKPLLGPEPFFGQGEKEGQSCQLSEDEKVLDVLQSARHFGPIVVFLGLHEDRSKGEHPALPSSDFSASNAAQTVEKLAGTPYFAIEVADVDTAVVEGIMKECSIAKEGNSLSWIESRSLMASMDRFTSAVFAEARSMADWNHRNKFCAGCGSPLYSMWGGWKLSCRTLLPWAKNEGLKPCISAKGLHNFTHPRTDPVVIMLAVDETGEKVLMGRNKKYPGKFYSALAGFIEPAESFEDAVRREMWEEAGVEITQPQYHSGQPWPYPANLMVGFYCRADSSKTIRIDLDNELEDARWFTRQEVLDVVGHQQGSYTPSSREKATLAAIWQQSEEGVKAKTSTTEAPSGEAKEPAFKVPPATAIAGVLIRDWVYGNVKLAPVGTGGARNNL